MKILVAVKRVVDYAVNIRARGDGRWVETTGIKHSTNPFDEIAVEAALRLRDAHGGSILAVSCGTQRAVDAIRSALAMGADAGIHVDTGVTAVSEDGTLQPLAVARLLKMVVAKENPDLVLLGKQAIDDDANQTGQMLAGFLGWPQAVFVSKLAFSSGQLTVAREVDGGVQSLSLKLPAVITVDLRLNSEISIYYRLAEPRMASLQNIMKARQKPITRVEASDLVNSGDIEPKVEVIRVTDPPKRAAGKKIDTVEELIAALQGEKVM